MRSKRRVKCGCRSRNDNDFSHRYPSIVKALARLPNETVVDGEVLALDQSGKPSFNALQNYDSSQPEIFFYVFDLLILAGRNVMPEPLSVRRTLLEERVLPKLHEPIRYSAELGAALPVLISSVKAQGLEGVVAKRRRGAYEPGLRTGSWLKWLKMPVNQGQEFVIGGYTLSDKNFDALIIGYYEPPANMVLFKNYVVAQHLLCPKTRGDGRGQKCTSRRRVERRACDQV